MRTPALFATCLLLHAALPGWTHAQEVIPLWPSGAPGESGSIGEEKDTTKPSDNKVGGKTVIRLGNVSVPTITVYRPAPEKDTGAAVLVCPGGGYHILALDLEGTEVCEWLNSIGVTGVLLKYRVPKRPNTERHLLPLQDAQRAMGLIRSNAVAWKLDPKRIGILGFSAGGHLAAVTSTNYKERAYPVIDGADKESSRPDFTALIYTAYLTQKENPQQLTPEMKVDGSTAPTFLVHAQDDPIPAENAVFYYAALKNAKVPAELHIFPSGGHGYGLRPTDKAVTGWPALAARWLEGLGVLQRK